MNLIVTVPSTTPWEDYQRELDAAATGATLNFLVHSLPRRASAGDRCYVCYRGEVVGYHIVSGMVEGEFTCTTTGQHWSGKFIQRTGRFHEIPRGSRVRMRGFQGYRYAGF